MALIDNKEIRRANLLGLIAVLDGNNMAAFGRRVAADPSLFSQIKNGTRQMGDRLARKIEVAIKKPHGWMDLPQFSQSEASLQQLEIAQILGNLDENDRDQLLRLARLMNQDRGKQSISNPYPGVPKVTGRHERDHEPNDKK